MTQSKMRKINLLDQSVISMIAAGEVIERPASALKELLENSIDSGASTIDVDIEEGGITLIKIVDNGIGIQADDLTLAVRPHATSKISIVADLDTISTLGFRGEALASISALSNMTVRSRPADAAQGAEITLHGSRQEETYKPCVMRAGTEISVRDLFSHAPARRKFLRKPATEWAHCEVMFQILAIGNPQLDFSLSRSGKKRIALKSQSQRERVLEVMGKNFAADCQEISHSAGPLAVTGLVSLNSTATGSRQHFFLNGRAIKDRLLRQAVRKAFTDVARQPDFPYAIFLEIPTILVDVNAHPAKTEVRFKEPNAMFSFVYTAMQKLANQPLGNNPNMGLEYQRLSNRSHRSDKDLATMPDRPSKINQPKQSVITTAAPLTSSPEPAVVPATTSAATLASSFLRPLQVAVGEEDKNNQPPADLGRVVGLLHGVYLLTENEQGLIVIDVHAAHERILYEQLKANNKENLLAQNLLESLELDLGPVEMDTVAEQRSALAEVGLYIKNDNGVEMLVAVPQGIADRDLDFAKMVLECIEELVECGHTTGAQEAINKVLATIACHAAVRGSNPFLLNKDLDKLLRNMESTLRSGKCNHGRPCWRMLKFSELDSYFERGR